MAELYIVTAEVIYELINSSPVLMVTSTIDNNKWMWIIWTIHSWNKYFWFVLLLWMSIQYQHIIANDTVVWMWTPSFYTSNTSKSYTPPIEWMNSNDVCEWYLHITSRSYLWNWSTSTPPVLIVNIVV